jgi:hypothetical protein
MAKALAAELEPFLTVEFEDVPGLEFINGKFMKGEAEVGELWFRITNSGKSPAVGKQICRRWSIANDGCMPAPIDIHAPQIRVSHKHGNLPIGGGATSGRVKARKDILPASSIQTGMVYFDGFLIFEDLSGRRFVTGFLLIFDNGCFHLAWPTNGNKPDSYNYHRKL